MPVKNTFFLIALVFPGLAWAPTAAPAREGQVEARIGILYVNTPTGRRFRDAIRAATDNHTLKDRVYLKHYP